MASPWPLDGCRPAAKRPRSGRSAAATWPLRGPALAAPWPRFGRAVAAFWPLKPDRWPGVLPKYLYMTMHCGLGWFGAATQTTIKAHGALYKLQIVIYVAVVKGTCTTMRGRPCRPALRPPGRYLANLELRRRSARGVGRGVVQRGVIESWADRRKLSPSRLNAQANDAAKGIPVFPHSSGCRGCSRR